MQNDKIIAKAYNTREKSQLTIGHAEINAITKANKKLGCCRLNNAVIYVTKEGDTISAITNNLGIDANTLNKENERIFILEDQLIVHKKEGNN